MNTEEWHPSREEIRRLMKMVKVLYTIQVLQENKEAVSKKTFANDGLYLVLLSACQHGAMEVITLFLDNHSDLFDVNETFKYGYTQEWSRPVNYVTLVEDTIGYIDEKQEERSDTLLGFVQRYNHKNKTEVIQLLHKHGASLMS